MARRFDPSLFQPLRKAGVLERRIIQPGRSLGKYSLYTLAFTYQLALVSLGVVFGGLVFWSLLVGSAGVFWLVISKTGYAKNFANSDVGYRKLIGLVGGFILSLGVIYGLIYLSGWIIPIFAAGLVLALLIAVEVKKRV